MYLAEVNRTTLVPCELKNWKIKTMTLNYDVTYYYYIFLFIRVLKVKGLKNSLVAIKIQRDVLFDTCFGVIKNLESCRVGTGSTTHSNLEVIWWRNDNRRIHISAKSTQRWSRLFTSIKNLEITALARGMVRKVKILEFQANIVIAWNGNIPRASDFIKRISGIGRWKDISWRIG